MLLPLRKPCISSSTLEVELGSDSQVDAIVRWAQRGPVMASVESVDVSPGMGSYSGFEIR